MDKEVIFERARRNLKLSILALPMGFITIALVTLVKGWVFSNLWNWFLVVSPLF